MLVYIKFVIHIKVNKNIYKLYVSLNIQFGVLHQAQLDYPQPQLFLPLFYTFFNAVKVFLIYTATRQCFYIHLKNYNEDYSTFGETYLELAA